MKKKKEDKDKNNLLFLDSNKKDNIWDTFNNFETLSDDIKLREKKYSSFGPKNKMKGKSKKNEHKKKNKIK